MHLDAERDLDEIAIGNASVAAKILAVLQEAKTSKKVQQALLDHKFGDNRDEDISVQRWQAMWRRGFSLWRLKVWECERYFPRYRVIYAYNPSELTFYILGVVDREWDYDENDRRTQRILEIYGTLNIRHF